MATQKNNATAPVLDSTTLTITRAQLDECGTYKGAPLWDIKGGINIAPDLGYCWVGGDIGCTGNLTIGKGTIFNTAGFVRVGDDIEGEGSLFTQNGSIHAQNIHLHGDLRAAKEIDVAGELYVGGSVEAGDEACSAGLQARLSIFVGGNLLVRGVVSTLLQCVIRGRADLTLYFTCGILEVGGDVHCHSIDSNEDIKVGGSITVATDIRAGKSIKAGSFILAKRRIFAGLDRDIWPFPSKDQSIECAELRNGIIGSGKLRLRPGKTNKTRIAA